MLSKRGKSLIWSLIWKTPTVGRQPDLFLRSFEIPQWKQLSASAKPVINQGFKSPL
jgi:hypothetical protein